MATKVSLTALITNSSGNVQTNVNNLRTFKDRHATETASGLDNLQSQINTVVASLSLSANPTPPVQVRMYIGIGLPGQPGDGATICLLGLPINGSFPVALANSVGSVGTNPTAPADYDVQLNGVSIGTISIDTAGAFTFTTASTIAIPFLANDRLTVIAPSPADTTLSDVEFILFALAT